jgi:hypothetical protein
MTSASLWQFSMYAATIREANHRSCSDRMKTRAPQPSRSTATACTWRWPIMRLNTLSSVQIVLELKSTRVREGPMQKYMLSETLQRPWQTPLHLAFFLDKMFTQYPTHSTHSTHPTHLTRLTRFARPRGELHTKSRTLGTHPLALACGKLTKAVTGTPTTW